MTRGDAALLLHADQIVLTIERLIARIAERFPGSGLGSVGSRLLSIANQAASRAEWIERPIYSLRIASALLVLLILAGIAATFVNLKIPEGGIGVMEFIQVLEAGINDVVLIGAGIFFLTTFENRLKRKRALEALHELRSVAHIIDMHQLTKDPEHSLGRATSTPSSPKGHMEPGDLARYLDYCSEMLSLTGKIAALYAQTFQDSVAMAAVNEIEDLTTGLARKIWQKLMVLYQMMEVDVERGK